MNSVAERVEEVVEEKTNTVLTLTLNLKAGESCLRPVRMNIVNVVSH